MGSLLGAGACSDDNGTGTDGSVKDSGGEGTAYKDLGGWPCDEIGKECNAHDSCALDPICRKSAASPTGGVCIAENFQNCDDGLECTEDTCAGLGICENKPKEGFCALRVRENNQTIIKCYAKDETKPDDQCQVCDPEKPVDGDGKPTEKTGREWTPKNGGSCDDGNPCTKDDYCQAGVCGGSDYSDKCTDNLYCTIDCDGKGECLTTKPIDAGFCLIGGKCQQDGAKNPANCSTCDVSKSQTAWTPTASTCLIGGKCYNPGEKNPGGCAECDPTVNANDWTVKVSDKCLIQGVCRSPGDQDAIKCGECVPATDKYQWTPISGKCKIFGVCYNTGEKNTGACAECDPAINANGWTVKGSDCLISNTCKKPQDTDPTGCQECDPTKDKYQWSAVAGKCKIGASCYLDGVIEAQAGCRQCTFASTPSFWSVNNTVTKQTYDFDSGTTLPTAFKTAILGGTGVAKWQVLSGKESFSGTNALYYGDASKMNYDVNGTGNGSSMSLENIALPAGKKSELVFKLWMDIDPVSALDEFNIYVAPHPMPSQAPKSAIVWSKAKVPAADHRKWVQQVVDLSGLAGQNVDIRIQFISYTPPKPPRQGIYIDDLWVLTGCK
jgi:hypothetical protein